MQKFPAEHILGMVICVTYGEICDYIYEIPKFTKKNDLGHTREALRRLGNPHSGFQVLHVAGSNGKGSTCACLYSVLRRAGLRPGLFTSPHLVCMEERFQIDGRICGREDFIWAFERVYQTVHEMVRGGLAHPTFFEYLFLMGMLIFQKHNVRYLVLETGLGGRLDTTNLFDEPLVTVITSISLEHTEILGNTIEAIAAEKAGIIKEGVPLVFDANEPRAAEVIRQRAKAVHAPYYAISRANTKILEITGKHIDFYFCTGYDGVTLRIPFVAEYQVNNAALAYQALKILSTELRIDLCQIARGLAEASWKGRMQEAADGVYFDGAHNPDGIAAFVDTVRRIGGSSPLLLFAMMEEKNYQKAVELLMQIPDWDEIILTAIRDRRGLDPQILAAEFAKRGRRTQVIEDCEEAYACALSRRRKGQKLFAAGSLYFIGELEKLTGGIS